MIGYVLIALGLGDLVGLAHYFAHHRTGLTGAVLALAAWVAHRFRRAFVSTGRRVAPPEVQKELRDARKLARKLAAA